MGAEFKYGIFCAQTTPSMCFDQVLFQTLSKPSAGFYWFSVKRIERQVWGVYIIGDYMQPGCSESLSLFIIV